MEKEEKLAKGEAAGIRILFSTRALRGFCDGMVSLTLPLYLSHLGFNASQIGLLATSMLLGSAAGTYVMGYAARFTSGRNLLITGAVLMGASGLAFLYVHNFLLLLIIAFIGTINPSTGDSSIFQPVEHAQLAHAIADHARTAFFSWYTFFGVLAAAFGSLALGLPRLVASDGNLVQAAILPLPFLLYSVVALLCLFLYARLPRSHVELQKRAENQRLGPSRRLVMLMTVLYSIDAFAGGFAVNSILALWLFQAYGLNLATAGAIFFWVSTVAAFSLLAAPRLAGGIGLINTMVFSHLPASVLLVVIPFMPSVEWAVGLLILRGTIGQLDVPIRISYLMSIVTPDERTAAAAVTAAPRSLMLALSPAIAGLLLSHSNFGWPLIVAGGLKIVYDILLLMVFGKVRPIEDRTEQRQAIGR